MKRICFFGLSVLSDNNQSYLVSDCEICSKIETLQFGESFADYSNSLICNVTSCQVQRFQLLLSVMKAKQSGTRISSKMIESSDEMFD
jgi:hypothetical protein